MFKAGMINIYSQFERLSKFQQNQGTIQYQTLAIFDAN